MSMDSLRSSATLRISHESETLIRSIQRNRNAFLNVFFRSISIFGEEKAFALGLPLLFWHYEDADAIIMCIVAWAVALYTGHFFKDLLQLPRPFSVCRSIKPMESHLGAEYGFPSTHALAGFCVPLTLLLLSPPSHSYWMFCAGYVALAASIAFSRLYLGVHSLLDVLGGASLGIVIAVLCSSYAPAIRALLRSPYGPLGLLVVGVASLYVYPDTPQPSPAFCDTASILGSASGCVIGDWILSNHILSVAAPHQLSFGAAVLKTAIGLAVIIGFHELSLFVTWRVIAGKRASEKNAKKDHTLYIPYKYCGYMPIGVHAVVTAPIIFEYFGF